MNLLEFLESVDDFDGELVPDNIETSTSFMWDDSISLTDESRAHFAEILQLPVTYDPESDFVYVLTGEGDDCRLDYQVDEFCRAVAGFIPSDLYDEWFVDAGAR